MHLTNYAVNKGAGGYIAAEADPNAGSKRTLSALLTMLAHQVASPRPYRDSWVSSGDSSQARAFPPPV